jgi:glycine hydroxymethyltransferase
MLPNDKDPRNPRGLRIGVQEMTRFGMKEPEMETIADFFFRILFKEESIREEVNEFRSGFRQLQYC